MDATRFSLQKRDWLKGALVAFGTAFLTTAMQSLNAGTMPTLPQLKISLIAGLAALGTYIIKNYFTDDVKVAEKVLAKEAEKEANAVQKQ